MVFTEPKNTAVQSLIHIFTNSYTERNENSYLYFNFKVIASLNQEDMKIKSKFYRRSRWRGIYSYRGLFLHQIFTINVVSITLRRFLLKRVFRIKISNIVTIDIMLIFARLLHTSLRQMFE